MELYQYCKQNDTIMLFYECHICGHRKSFAIKENHWKKYNDGALINQMDMSYLDNESIEIIKHRTCIKCKGFIIE